MSEKEIVNDSAEETSTEDFANLVSWGDEEDSSPESDGDTDNWDIEIPEDVDKDSPVPAKAIAALQEMEGAEALKEELEKKFQGDENGSNQPSESPEKTGSQSKTNSESESEESQNEPEASEVLELAEYLEKLDNSKIRHKIDGEVVEIEVKDAIKKVLNEYSGHQAVDKRFTEFDKKVKAFESEKKEIEHYLDQFGSHMRDGDAMGAFQFFAQFAGFAPHVVKEQLIAAVTPEVERRSALRPEEILNESLKAENEYLNSLKESELKRRAEEKARKDLQNSINKAREALQVTEEEWNASFKELDETLPPDVAINVDMVKDHIKTKKDEAAFESRMDSLLGDYKSQVNDEYIKELGTIMKNNPQLDDEVLKQIIEQSFVSVSPSQEDVVKKELTEKINRNKVPTKEEELELDSLVSWDR